MSAANGGGPRYWCHTYNSEAKSTSVTSDGEIKCQRCNETAVEEIDLENPPAGFVATATAPERKQSSSLPTAQPIASAATTTAAAASRSAPTSAAPNTADVKSSGTNAAGGRAAFGGGAAIPTAVPLLGGAMTHTRIRSLHRSMRETFSRSSHRPASAVAVLHRLCRRFSFHCNHYSRCNDMRVAAAAAAAEGQQRLPPVVVAEAVAVAVAVAVRTTAATHSVSRRRSFRTRNRCNHHSNNSSRCTIGFNK